MTFINLVNPQQFIALYHCSVHNLKALRNALSNSKEKVSQAFVDVHDSGEIQFGWAQMAACYGWDKDHKPKDSSMCKEAIILYKWAVMNVSYAKAPCMPNTITEQLQSLASKLQLMNGELLVKDGDEVRNVDIYRQRIDALLWLKAREFISIPTTTWSELSCASYCIAVGSIFVENFLNRNAQI
jgi:hypothetical protein